MDNEFLLYDRLEKIRSVISQYGVDNFAISYSGGKDSCVVDKLVDMAIPDNEIPRVYVDTGIEYNMIRQFVADKAKTDARVKIISPSKSIKKTLEEYGYPFKSKEHSAYIDIIRRNGLTCKTADRYLNPEPKRKKYGCLPIFYYQLTDDFHLKISDKCCDKLKKEPLKEALKQLGKKYWINGILPSEGGQRSQAKCLAFADGKLKAFQPLVAVTKMWEEWFIDNYNVPICDIYKPPYNFKRTGCKGCPFNYNLQRDLDVMKQLFPAEYKQCEIIWKPVYDEYRRIGYRLKKENET